MMPASILMIGAFDSKAAEFAFLREQILAQGADVVALNFGVLGSTDLFPVDVEADEVARAGGTPLADLRAGGDRGRAMHVMAAGAAQLARHLYNSGQIGGVIGMGGSGGSSVATAAMRALPLGVPKVCISTVAGGDTSAYVGVKDVTLMPSITDVSGVNRISRTVMTRAAGAIVGMLASEPPSVDEDKPIVAASMFGNTTQCVDACRDALMQAGYEVLVFHAVGTGGRTMESLISEGLVDACLDITTTEWADQLCGGVFPAGEDRLSAPGRAGIPHLIVPGCIDMVNFGPRETVPQKYRDADRLFYEWNPSVTLMRTSPEENRRLGEIFAQKANAANGPVAFLLPLRGFSILGGDGQPFCDREADQAFCSVLKANLRSDIHVAELEANINEPAFSAKAVEMLLDLVQLPF